MNYGQAVAVVEAFQNLARRIDIEFPEHLAALMGIAHTAPSKAALSSLVDFHWLDAEEAEREINEWLNPDDQQGRTFLPFAATGGGEPYCLVRLENGTSGIAQVLHFAQPSSLAHADISSFVTREYVRVATDLSWLPPQKDFSIALKSEVALIETALLPADYALLEALFSRLCIAMNYQAGPQGISKIVKAFISQEEEESLAARLRHPNPTEFEALRAWMR
ncbi:hypothetical protein CEQ51_21325 [Pseudomonas thivervalensis]|uniref:Uncharacterized protein n=1 Tax=Pseudomonas thivervalensis TaxID=86265 RepID=A0A2Z4ZF24_9PSED|nr:hypothetical protein CE140_20775 [Pseudomonas thivervalensis]AXA62511.1 hypothetical protein CEQ51_21325 [Pseudomonas thivervalensis]